MLTPTSHVGAIGVDSHIDPVPGSHTAHPDTDLKVMEEKNHHASPSDEALASVEPHKPNHEIPASVDSAAHGKSRSASDALRARAGSVLCLTQSMYDLNCCISVIIVFPSNVPNACRDKFRSDLQACKLHHLTQQAPCTAVHLQVTLLLQVTRFLLVKTTCRR